MRNAYIRNIDLLLHGVAKMLFLLLIQIYVDSLRKKNTRTLRCFHPDRQLTTLSLPFLNTTGGENTLEEKAHGLRTGQGDPSLITIMGKTD